MNRTPYDFASAKAVYSGRLDKVLGRKIRSNAWMKFDDARRCFVLNEVKSSYSQDVNGHYRRERDKTKWTMSPYAEIYEDRVVVLRVAHNNFLYNLRVQSERSRTNKFSGRTWYIMVPSGRGYLRGAHVNGEPPVTVQNGTITVAAPAKVRTVDNEARKEFNRRIQKIRNLLKVRMKLGAFRALSMADLITHASKQGYTNKYELYSTPSKFSELLDAVTEDDIESFYPVLWVSLRQYYYAYNNEQSIAGVDWVERFNVAVDSMREKIKQASGVVKYVEVAETDEGANGEGSEAQAAE